MGLSGAEQLGKLIADGRNETERLKEDVFPSDVATSMLLSPFEKVRLRLMVTGTKKFYASDSFILDHPVFGELDSATLKLDGGYDGSLDEEAFTYST